MDHGKKKSESEFLTSSHSFHEYGKLMQLVESGRLDDFKVFWHQVTLENSSNLDINFSLPYPHLKTFLDVATLRNFTAFVRFLLQIGADPNLLNAEYQRAPIHFAAENGSIDVLSVLLQFNEIDYDLKTPSGLTALHFAVTSGSEECVKLLLEAGASPNIPNNKGITAIHLAVNQNKRKIVELILICSSKLDIDTFK